MRLLHIKPKRFFHVLAQTSRSQVAEMVLKPGQSTGDSENKHPKSDQWLYVTSGTGKAKIKERTVDIKEGDLLLIEAGEIHEIKNSGEKPLKTFNIYAPKEY